jgi:hypothetical protein
VKKGNSLKTIRSNKKGFGIHSPFVYNLVTNVLFVSPGFYIFDEIEKLNTSSDEKSQLRLLFRLLNHFQPDFVFYDGDWVNEEDLCILKRFNPGALFRKIDPGFFDTAGINPKTFLILNEIRDFAMPGIPGQGTWFFKSKPDKSKVNLIFKPLLEKEDGIILIELLNEDLIIFDKKFPSQHYVIK